jgi:hypothetical protein
MSKEIDITPKTHCLSSLRRQDMPPWLAVCELVDNSLDANATSVCVVWDAAGKCLTVSDDGVGAPNPSAIVTLGDHDSEGRETSGRYGIGAKDAVLALGTAAEVTVVRNGLYRLVRADFEEIRLSGKWIAREEDRQAEGHEHHGTCVRVKSVDRRIDTGNIVKRLCKTFSPALRRGIEIRFDGSPLSPPVVVEVEEMRTGDGVFRGKRYTWWAGIRSDGQRVDGGWRFEFKHRTLEDNSCNRSYGTEGMDIHKFYGVITLVEPEDADDGERWLVNKHKTSADELQDLCESLFPEVSDLLERCAEEHSMTLEAAICDDIGRGLTEALSRSARLKEKRAKPDDEQHGTSIPRDTGRRRRHASKTQAGDGSITIRDPLTGKKFRINFADDDRFGWVTGDRKANVVYLGRQHEYWQRHLQDAEIVLCSAMALLAGHAITTEGTEQPIMSVVVQCDASNERFFNTLGNIAAQVVSNDEAVAP